jgi:hypothetical protein
MRGEVIRGRAFSIRRCFRKMPHNIRMHLTGYSRLRALPPAGDAGRYAASNRFA